MKIGILVESFPRVSEAWLANQIIDLIEKGQEISIYSVYPTREKIIHEQVNRYQLKEKTHYFFYPKTNRVKRIFLGLGFIFRNLENVTFKKVYRSIEAVFLKKLEPLFAFNAIFLKDIDKLDILHAHFGNMGVFAAKMKRVGLLDKTKIVVSFHGHDIFPYKKDVYKKDYQIFNDFADALLVNSIYSERLLEGIISYFNVNVIPVGLSLAYFIPSRIPNQNQKIRLVFLGRLVYLKGGLAMIEIFYRLFQTNKDLELVVIGDGEQRFLIEEKIKEYGLMESVILKGALSHDAVIEEFNASDIYVYPGFFDPFFKAGETQGLVVQEAQAMELPVVCTDIGGIKYGMVDGKTGFLVPEGNIDCFLEKIQFLIDHPEVRIKVGKAGREFVKSHFDSKVIGDQLMSVYSEILNAD
jgi:colanic acid/amylovoran biosynthesis glycosyltransferase